MALSLLAGCAGVSAGAGPNVQPQPGNLSLSSSSIDFGSIAAGSNKTLTLTATNSGSQSVTINSASIASSYFAVTAPNLPATVAGGASASITLKFTPNAAGPFSSTLTIASTAANSSINIPLTGTGMANGQLGFSPTSAAFGSVTVGSQQTLSVTLTNSGTTSVTVSQASMSGTGFSLTGITTPATLGAGQSAVLSLTFAPQSTGAASGTLTLTSNATNSTLTLPLSGTGIAAAGALTSNPSSEAFGNVTVGTQKSLSETVTNTGGTTITISQVSASGTGFSVSGITAPVTLTAGQSKAFNILFSPQSAGAASGIVTVTSNAPNPTLTVPLTGTGIAAGQLTSNPTSLAFGSVTTGNQLSLPETVTNTGGTSVTISQASITGTGFALSGITTPVTLGAGQSTNVTVTFTPGSAGAVSGNLTFTSNAPNPTLTVPLSGTGVAPGQLTSNPTSLTFGNVTVASQQSLTETVTNTGGTSVTISQAGASGTGFSLSGITTPKTLTAGQSTTFTVTFAPSSAGAASGSVTLTSNAPNPTLTIPLSGTGVTAGQLSGNPSSLGFGSITVGSQQSLSETVTNTGGTTVTISQASASGTGFSISGITTPKTLTAGQSTTFTVTFAPSATGAASGSVTLTSNAPNPTLTVPLSGTGAAQPTGTLAVSPTTIALGNVTVGSSGTASGSLTASGASVTVTAASANNSAFAISGLSLPVTIPAGQSVPFTITFSPQSATSFNATLTFTSNAQPATTTATLTGTGTAATPHTVSLSWTASTSSGVAGYNVYRAVYNGACGAMAKINSVLETATVYTDSAVTNGTSYCYATTAVDSSNNESTFSNIVTNVAIP